MRGQIVLSGTHLAKRLGLPEGCEIVAIESSSSPIHVVLVIRDIEEASGPITKYLQAEFGLDGPAENTYYVDAKLALRDSQHPDVEPIIINSILDSE